MNFPLPKYIEIETSRFCNRRCSWCPNGNFSVRREQELMDWKLFSKLLHELRTLGFRGWLALHNYNEPLANPRLLMEIGEANASLPGCSLSIFSNGDYLNATLLADLAEKGVRYLRITLYPSQLTASFDEARAASRIERWLETKRLKQSASWQIKNVRQGTAAAGDHNGMNVEIISPDLSTYNHRGGTAAAVATLPRSMPCFMTSHSAAIDFRGQMKMCCNVFPEAAVHKRYVVGDLNEKSFEEIWDSQEMKEFRMRHSRADWSNSPICQSCIQRLKEEQIQSFKTTSPT